MFLGLLQIAGWVAAGYNIKAHNFWAVTAFMFGTVFVGVAQILYKMAGDLNNGNSSNTK